MRITSLMFVLAVSVSAFAQNPGKSKTSNPAPPTVGGQDGNGGGGVVRGGVYMTFYSAGLFVNAEELTDVPGSNVFANTIVKAVIRPKYRSVLMGLALPNSGRHFYKVMPERFDTRTLDRLLSEYSRVSGQPTQSLALFAITDIKTWTTYLLPNFYKLNESEQAAILFHEAYWIARPDSTYLEVVRAELSFQEFLTAQKSGNYSPSFGRNLGRLFKDDSIPVKAALSFDLANGNLNDLGATTEGLPAFAILPRPVFSANTSNNASCFYGGPHNLQARFHWYFNDGSSVQLLSQTHPRSYFLKELAYALLAGHTTLEVYSAIAPIPILPNQDALEQCSKMTLTHGPLIQIDEPDFNSDLFVRFETIP